MDPRGAAIRDRTAPGIVGRACALAYASLDLEATHAEGNTSVTF
jgi:hypothetical protein